MPDQGFRFLTQAELLADIPLGADKGVDLSEVFKDVAVPQDPSRAANPAYARQVFQDTPQNRAAAARAVAALTAAPGKVILSDIDGTCAPFAARVEDAGMVPGYLDTAKAIAANPSDTFAFITGRGREDAFRIVGAKPPCSVIYSHGTACLYEDGRTEEIPLSLNEEKDLAEIKTTAQQLKEEILGATLQIKHSGIDLKITNNNITPLRDALETVCADKPAFQVCSEGSSEVSVRYALADKSRAIDTFVVSRLTKPALLCYIGDSFGPEGTDRKAAEYVQKNGGIVVQVLNDRPAPEDGFKPDVILPNPQATAAFCRLLTPRIKG